MPRGGVLARFYRPGGRGFELSFCPEVLPGGWSGLELTDTLVNHGVIIDCNDLQKTENCETSEKIFFV